MHAGTGTAVLANECCPTARCSGAFDRGLSKCACCAVPACRWLDPAQPASLQQTLVPAGSGEVGSGPALLQYEVVVFTSDTRGAGTDSNVSIELVGASDRSGALRLDTRCVTAAAAAY